MNNPWPYLLVVFPPSLEEPLTAILFACGCSGTASDTVRVADDESTWPILTAWFPDSTSRDEAVRRLHRHFGGLEAAERPRIETGSQEDVDWMARWREGQQPFPVGRRLLVIPGEGDPVPLEHAGRIVLRITPGLAFGTGHHETTRFCLEQLEREAGDAEDFLDVGTGSGILAVAAVLLGIERVVGIDIDAQAIAAASANIAKHGLSGRIDLKVSGTVIEADLRPFTLVAANILGGTLMTMAPVLSGHVLKPGGRLLLAGILAGDEERAVTRVFGECGLACLRREIDSEWAGLVMSKPGG